jgi:hypothetical protein
MRLVQATSKFLSKNNHMWFLLILAMFARHLVNLDPAFGQSLSAEKRIGFK